MRFVRRLLTLLVSTGIALAACTSGGTSAADSNEEFCEGLWDRGPTPAGWDKTTVMKDCTDGLESGYTRDEIVDVYTDMETPE
jgi:hypothetical protein